MEPYTVSSSLICSITWERTFCGNNQRGPRGWVHSLVAHIKQRKALIVRATINDWGACPPRRQLDDSASFNLGSTAAGKPGVVSFLQILHSEPLLQPALFTQTTAFQGTPFGPKFRTSWKSKQTLVILKNWKLFTDSVNNCNMRWDIPNVENSSRDRCHILLHSTYPNIS